ncbi:MAG: glycine--tRNA ligase subunit beta, partial [Actinomycetes bacterium]|nr:glycine--tRNA ligase subunit beta [Actinomycetes bacterium]
MDVKAYTHDLLFEIGAEEMPSGPLYDAAQQLEVNAGQALRHARLHYRDLTVYFTPRRLSLLVRGLADQQAEETKTVRGPKTTYAYDVDTKEPTKALTGFLAKNALTAADITIIDDVVTATVTTAAEKTTAVLPALLTGLITSISWKKPQRWGSGDEKFIRPVRWLLAIYGAAVVPLRFGDIIAGNTTRGHRFLSRGPVTIAAMREYKNVLRGNHVIVDAAARRAEIVSATMTAADAYGAALIDDTVLAEVVNLTEFPNALVGAFDEEFLRVPREILQYAMSTHQRYFAIQRPDGKLDNHFVVISNG